MREGGGWWGPTPPRLLQNKGHTVDLQKRRNTVDAGVSGGGGTCLLQNKGNTVDLQIHRHTVDDTRAEGRGGVPSPGR